MAEEKPIDQKTEKAEKHAERVDDEALDLDLPKPVDILSAPLQVEEMPESSELQKRRQQTKNKLREFAGVEESDSTDVDEAGGLLDIIRESGLSTRHVKFCCGGVFAILLLAGAVYGVLKGWDYYKNRPITEPVVEEPDTSPHTLFGTQIETGIKIGFEEADKDSSTLTGEELGTERGSQEEYVRFVSDFEKIYNILQVDVQDLIDQSNDRTLAIDKYLDQLEELLNIANLNLRQLQREEADLIAQFETKQADQAADEEAFFNSINNLDGNAANSNLRDFISVSKEVLEIRANYRARLKLDDFYNDGITELELRIKDIKFNKEALVKGVRVVELQGSDLKLIIDGSQL